MRSRAVPVRGCHGAGLGAGGLPWGRAGLPSRCFLPRAAPMGWEARGTLPRDALAPRLCRPRGGSRLVTCIPG